MSRPMLQVCVQMTETVAVWVCHRSRRRKKVEAADPFGKTPEMM